MNFAELSLSLPILSAVFLLIAGVLVGYALAFPMRGESDLVASELRAMREQNEDLESALHQQRDAHARIERRDSARNEEWTALQASARRMEAALEARTDGTASDERLRAARHEKEAVSTELAKEREQRSALQSRCDAQANAMNELRTTAEDYRDLQAKYNTLREELVQKQQQLSHVDEHRTKIADDLTARDDELRSISQGRANFASEKLDLQQKLMTLEAAASRQTSRLEELEIEKLAALDQLENERAQRSSTEDLLEATERSVRELSQTVELVAERDQEITMLTSRLTAVESASAQQAARHEEASARMGKLQGHAGHLREELESHRQAFEIVGRQRNELQAKYNALAAQLDTAEEQAAKFADDRRQLNQVQAEANQYVEQLQQNQMEFESTASRLRETTIERDAAHAQVTAVQKALEEAHERLRAESNMQDALRNQREEVLGALRVEEKRHIDTSNSLEEQTQRYQRQAAQSRDERDRALAELRSLKVSASQAAAQGDRANDRAEVHPTLGTIYHSAPDVKDDLKRISGIAAVLESRLNDLGIYTYRQVMEWNERQVAEFSKLLSFPDRIARDNWVGQAARLHQDAQESGLSLRRKSA